MKDTVVSGSLRATDTLYSTTAQFKILRAPTASNGTTYGPGTANNLLKSNGTSIYWTTLAVSDIPTISITGKTSGTLTVERGGTGQTSIANIQAGKDGDGNTISSTYLKLSGGTMTGKLTFNKVQNAIAYTGTKGTNNMIKFIDNTENTWGNGICIGEGGATIIGGGESANAAMAQISGVDEVLYLCNDADVNIFTNMDGGWANRKTFTFGANGTLTASTFSGSLNGNASTATKATQDADGNTISSTYLKLSGGTMTNSLTITKAGECGIEVNNTQSTNPNQVAFIIGQSGNGGIFSRKHSKWIVYADASGNVVLNGNANTASAFSANKSVTLTGDVTGSASSTGGWSIATTIGEGKVTNAMLAGSIANGKLANSSIKIGNKTISLGGTATLADIGVSYPVTGVKGNAENSYRTGQVNLTSANIGAVAKSGDTMTGNLSINLAAITEASYRFGTLAGSNDNYTSIDQANWGLVIYSLPIKNNSDNTIRNARFRFHEFSPNSNGTRTSYYEGYRLPIVDVGRTASIDYDILTTKNAVKVDQGGTGATSAPAAKANLGLGSAAMDFSVTNFQGATQHWGIGGVVQASSSATKTYLGKKTNLIALDDGLFMYNSTDSATIWTLNVPVKVTQGGTGATTPAQARTNLEITPANIGAAVSIELTNQNLNVVTVPGFYNAGGGNTCANKPSGVDSFGMVVVHSASGAYYTQTLYTSGGTIWRRINSNGTWSDWQEEIGQVDLITDFNDFIPDNEVNVHWKYLRTTSGNASNAPISGDNITFYGWVMGAPNYCTQCVYVVYADTASNRGRQFVRCRVNGTWQSWIEVLGTHNYTSYCPTKTGSGASGTWGINISGNASTATTSTSVFCRSSLTKGTNPSALTWTSSWFNYQTGTGTAVTDRVAGGIESYVDANGLSAICFRSYKYASNSSETNSIEIRIAKDGTCSYSVTSPSAFRTAINAVSKIGDTMTGPLTISHSYARTTYSDGTREVLWVGKANATNAAIGLHSSGYYNEDGTWTADSAYIVHRASGGNIYLNGRANSLPDRTLTIGSKGKTFNGTANVSWSLAEIGATVSNTWTNGTTAGPTIKTTVNGVAGTAVEIPSATSAQSGVVTTGTQTFTGEKYFNVPNFLYVRSTGDTVWPGISFGSIEATRDNYTTTNQAVWNILYTQFAGKKNSDGTYYQNRFFFRSYSDNGAGARVSYYEDYYLPQADRNKTANSSYNILTTKDMSFSITGNAANVTGTVLIEHGGTGAITAPAARENLQIARHITFTSSMDTSPKVLLELGTLAENRTAVFRSHSTPMKILSNNKISNSGVSGLILQIGSSLWRVLAFVGSTIWSWEITGTDPQTGNLTIANVYKYTGTSA